MPCLGNGLKTLLDWARHIFEPENNIKLAYQWDPKNLGRLIL
jgi:hypothetical protein